MKNKILKSTLLALTLAFGLTGCGGSGEKAEIADSTTDTNSTAEVSSEKKSVVCTTFPQYDWVKNLIAGKEDSYELTLLMDTGADLHNYQPTADDMIKISDCDLFIYVGGESDEWVEDALKSAVNENMESLSLMETLGDSVKEEELVEGMEGEEEEHDHEENKGEEEEEAEYDEHVWLSLKNAETITGAIAEKLTAIDSENAELYTKNCEEYVAKLDELDKKYTELTEGAANKTLLFGDRFPFRYMVEDYGLDYYAAFVGCSAETEASFETIAFLAQKVDELNLSTVYVLENSDKKIADAIVSNTQNKNATIATLNSLQSINKTDIEKGVSYLSVMEENLNTLKDTLTKGE